MVVRLRYPLLVAALILLVPISWLSSARVAAQPAEISTLCVNPFTGSVRDGSSGCLPGQTALEIPDDFPFTLCASLYTGSVRFSGLGTCTPYELTLDVPDSGALTLCASRYTGALRYHPTGTCPGTDAPMTLIGNAAPVTVDDGPESIFHGAAIDFSVTSNDDLGFPEATVASFGDSPGTVGTFPADGVTVLSVPAPGGGTIDVTINASGNVNVIANGTTGTGQVSFYYLLDNGVGSSIGMITIQYQNPA